MNFENSGTVWFQLQNYGQQRHETIPEGSQGVLTVSKARGACNGEVSKTPVSIPITTEGLRFLEL